jgi:hypothetical protein
MANLLETLTQGLTSQDTLKDYQHASKVFVNSQYLLSPKYAFLFYVVFDFAQDFAGLRTDPKKALQMGALCKSASLPKFTVENQVVNTYNRSYTVQKKLKYDPVTLKFHDDSNDIIREFWYDYMTFYYRDTDHAPAMYRQNHKYIDRPKDSWGYNLRNEFNTSAEQLTNTNPRPLNSIRIYSFSQQKFSEYQLINPVITAFRHGEHNNEGSNLLEHEMTIQYETVKYAKGSVTQDNFSDSMLLLYDNLVSPLKSGVTRSVFGAGGFVDTIDNVMNDLATGNFAGAWLRINKAQQTFKGANIGDMLVNEGLAKVGAYVGSGTPTYVSSPVRVPSPADATNSINGSGISGIQASEGIAPSGSAGLNANANNPVISGPNGTRVAEFLMNNAAAKDEALAKTDTRATSYGEVISTTPDTPGTAIQGFPQLESASAANLVEAVRYLQTTTVDNLDPATLARLNLTQNDAKQLITYFQQGTPRA